MAERRERDIQQVRQQLGREPTTSFTVVARCSPGHPLVIRNEPLDADGRPFPTRFWLTCPDAVRAVARLESAGEIARFNARAEADPAFAAELASAHDAYAEERSTSHPDARGWGGVGGTRTGVKCLHAHYANHLAGGADPVGSWVAGKVEPVHQERPGRVAAIDQGTNSIRLLIVEPARGGPVEIARDMVITRLGQGVDRTGTIAPEALRRTVSVLERYGRRARALHAERIHVAATSAVRDAANREELERAVLQHTGSPLEVITGEREAALTFGGATHGLEEPAPFLVLDIGGGSTEFVLGEDQPRAALSTQMGSVRLTERCISHDPPLAEELDAARRVVLEILDDVERQIPVRERSTFVAVAGTATTVQAITLGLPGYDPDLIHRTRLPAASAERVLEDLARMTTAERAALPVMAAGRADVIVAGALILVTVMRRLEVADALVSETDILDGLAFEMLRTL